MTIAEKQQHIIKPKKEQSKVERDTISNPRKIQNSPIKLFLYRAHACERERDVIDKQTACISYSISYIYCLDDSIASGCSRVMVNWELN